MPKEITTYSSPNDRLDKAIKEAKLDAANKGTPKTIVFHGIELVIAKDAKDDEVTSDYYEKIRSNTIEADLAAANKGRSDKRTWAGATADRQPRTL